MIVVNILEGMWTILVALVRFVLRREPAPLPEPTAEARTARLRGADFRRPDPWDEDAHAVAIREMKNRTGEVRTYNG